ncbi:MAG TPA: hypothetical protein VFZ75_06690 [Actinomycetota bacterium]|nr:hypothetical protein [Actinomycetota bacterium]
MAGSEPPDGDASEPVVELGPPISDVPWSPELSTQSLEVLIVTLDDDAPVWLKPEHADSLRIGLPATARPGDVVLETLNSYALTPRVVHSTSWRHEEGRVVLSYVAVVDAPSQLLDGTLVRTPVVRADLARGDATAPPPEIGVLQVIEHALRHLSWLVQDDPAIGEALPDWRELLERYQPEPFRALG